MDIKTDTPIKTTSAYTPVQISGSGATEGSNPASKLDAASKESEQQKAKDPEMSKADIEKLSASLNKILQLVNADLQFAMHEKTQRFMVRLVDVKTDKVLKEFPPHELLDTLAAIRDYIGLLLDKKV